MNWPHLLRDGLAQASAASPWALLLAKVTLLLAVAWLVHFGLTWANPRWRTLLWHGTAVGLLLLAVWTFALPGLMIRVAAPTPVATAPPPAAQPIATGREAAVPPDTALPPMESPAPTDVRAATRETVVRPETALPVEPPRPSLSWSTLFLGFWGLGVALLAIRLAFAYRKLVGLLETSQAVPEHVAAEVGRIAAVLGCRTVHVRSSRQYAVPFLYGLRRPLLVLPERMCQPVYRAQLPGIIAHELAHVRAGDFGWNALLQAVSLWLWFHPLAWRMGSAHRAACDAVCDAVSAAYLGDVEAYCRTLARVALEGAASFPPAGLAMARTCDVRRRITVLQQRVFAASLGRRAVVGAMLVAAMFFGLLAGLRLALAEVPAQASKAQTAKAALPSAAALMQAVYQSRAWIESARSFHIRLEYKFTYTEEGARSEKMRAKRQPFASTDDRDLTKPFRSKDEWAWDESHVLCRTQSCERGEAEFKYRQTTVWDGTLAVEYGESADHKQYVLGNKADRFLDHQVVGMLQLPWGPGDGYHLWWSPADVAKYRADWGIAPEDFELAGQEDVGGRRCYVVQSRAGHYRMHIGVADGRLYRRTWLIAHHGTPGYHELALYQKIAGPQIKSGQQWHGWLESLKPDERRRAFRELRVAEFEFARTVFCQTFADYREVAPGCWLAFRQTVDHYEWDAGKQFLDHQTEQVVTEVAVNRPLPKELFHVELVDGVPVSTDWRYDPPIRYTYRKNQTEAERVALCEAERAKLAKSQKMLKKFDAVVEGRMGQLPPPLPASGWLDGKPLNWKDLRGKVVMLHFWEVGCGPCLNELPLVAGWHENAAQNGTMVIGIHPPTKDLAAVRKVLARFDAKYPVLIDSPAAKKGGLGLLHDWFGNSYWPHTVLIGKDGLVAAHGDLWMGDVGKQVQRLSMAEPVANRKDGHKSSGPGAEEAKPAK
jgi:beta-lactamase regulating signal transducer with metallopeptidase domain/thiol-disulfide isomerase/thioredoxin